MAEEAAWYRKTGSGWTISVHAQPGARKSEVIGLHGDAIKIRIASPPLDGRANEALIGFMAQALGVPRAAVSLARGAASRRKEIFIGLPGADPAQLLALRPGPGTSD